MIDYSECYHDLGDTALRAWVALLPGLIAQKLDQSRHGHLDEWFELLAGLPAIVADKFEPGQDTVEIGSGKQLSASVREPLIASLRTIMPWRKGPFRLFDIPIETEWRSDWKWRRLQGNIHSLQSRRVLDVGCGNGYHCFRMHAEGASLVIGIEPLLRYHIQFHLLRHFLGKAIAVHLLPLTLETLPGFIPAFDTVFSMGVLYHRRSPIDHLFELKACLKPGGQLVLETLVVADSVTQVLVPKGRYAKMRNVWFIPDVIMLETWLQRAGFVNIRLCDISVTTLEEQKSTDWMQFESLADFLDPEDRSRTIEGYPAPRRAILVADNRA